MSKTTNNLKLYEVVPATDGKQKFNFQRILNDNWETIDRVVGGLRLDVNLMPDADDIGEMIAEGLTGVLKVKTGSYTGDGTSNTVVELDTPSKPLVVFIREVVPAGGRGASVTIPTYSMTESFNGNAISYMYQTAVSSTLSGNAGALIPLYCTVTDGSVLMMRTDITGTQAPAYHFNSNRTTYAWVAIYAEKE